MRALEARNSGARGLSYGAGLLRPQPHLHAPFLNAVGSVLQVQNADALLFPSNSNLLTPQTDLRNNGPQTTTTKTPPGRVNVHLTGGKPGRTKETNFGDYL